MTPIEEIPTPDLAVPYAAPMSVCCWTWGSSRTQGSNPRADGAEAEGSSGERQMFAILSERCRRESISSICIRRRARREEKGSGFGIERELTTVVHTWMKAFRALTVVGLERDGQPHDNGDPSAQCRGTRRGQRGTRFQLITRSRQTRCTKMRQAILNDAGATTKVTTTLSSSRAYYLSRGGWGEG